MVIIVSPYIITMTILRLVFWRFWHTPKAVPDPRRNDVVCCVLPTSLCT
jgi:hypothetical protein